MIPRSAGWAGACLLSCHQPVIGTPVTLTSAPPAAVLEAIGSPFRVSFAGLCPRWRYLYYDDGVLFQLYSNEEPVLSSMGSAGRAAVEPYSQAVFSSLHALENRGYR